MTSHTNTRTLVRDLGVFAAVDDGVVRVLLLADGDFLPLGSAACWLGANRAGPGLGGAALAMKGGG